MFYLLIIRSSGFGLRTQLGGGGDVMKPCLRDIFAPQKCLASFVRVYQVQN